MLIGNIRYNWSVGLVQLLVKCVCRVMRGVRSFVGPVDFWQMKNNPISRFSQRL